MEIMCIVKFVWLNFCTFRLGKRITSSFLKSFIYEMIIMELSTIAGDFVYSDVFINIFYTFEAGESITNSFLKYFVYFEAILN